MSSELVNQGVPASLKVLLQNRELRERKCLKTTTSIAPVVNLRRSLKGSVPSLSGPEPRSVAGHVSREKNRTRMAEAAPSNSSQRGSRPVQPPNRRRKRTKRANSSNDRNDGSDSEPEGRDDGSDKDSGPSRRRTIQSQENESMDDGSSATLSREENDRVRLLQMLTKVGSEWNRLRLLRQHNIVSGRRRIQWWVSRFGNYMNDLPATSDSGLQKEAEWVVLENQSRRRQEYLDDALYGHIEDKQETMDYDGSALDRLDELVQRAELGIIQCCRSIDPYARSWDLLPPKAPARLICIVKNLYSASWNYLSALPQDLERNRQDTFVASCRFLEERFHKEKVSNWDAMIVDPVIDSYSATMVEGLSEDLALDKEAGRRRSDLNTLRVCEKIQTSRHGDHLTSTYCAWAASRIDPEKKDEVLLKWNRNKQKETLTTFRQIMSSAKMSIRQEFCANIVTPGVVSLVLFKENWPSAVKDVTPDELRDMGWVSEELASGHQFVRLEHRVQGGQKYVFKISMDEEVLAVQRPHGSHWIYWDENGFAREQNGRHMSPYLLSINGGGEGELNLEARR